tara:strand:+ start:10501 stop:11634 length:1134 start_codon:yes stop_codon:yes gene_type:complete
MIVIIGSGIAALWTANLLNENGFDVIVLEKDSVASNQTIASQGMIHGGTKYSLDGVLTKATQSISEMPSTWRDALNGNGKVDLSESKINAHSQVLWSADTLHSKILSFFGSKAMSSKMQPIDKKEHPAFSSKDFKGSLFKLNELVVDVQSVVANLTKNLDGKIIKAKGTKILLSNGKVIGIETSIGKLECDELILAAGEGNEQILKNSNVKSFPMQTRPLAMGMVYMNKNIPDIFGHHLGSSSRPKVTISTHYINKKQILYIGGEVSESGVNLSDEQQVIKIERSLKEALSWIDLDIDKIEVLRINRAEAKNKNVLKPDSFFIGRNDGLMVCWPTKLAFAPLIAENVLDELNKPILNNSKKIHGEKPEISNYPWESN